MKIITLGKAVAVSKTAVISTAKAIAIGAVYFLLCALNPLQAFNPFLSLIGITNMRIADIMRPLAFFSPAGALGIAAGGHAYNLYTGKVAVGAYPIMPIIIFAIWVVFGALGKRYANKELLLIAIAGLITGLVVSLHLTSLAVLVQGSVWSKLLTIGVQVKIATHMALPVVGYLAFGKSMKKVMADD